MSNLFEITNPYNHQSLGSFPFDSQESIDEKMNILKKGIKTLNNMPAFQRADILNKTADILLKNADKIAKTITSEMGKTISDSLVEITRSANTCRCAADEAKRINGEVLSSDSYSQGKKRIAVIQKKPLGIILAITPFNFPVNLSVHKIAPAFASGNVVIFKPGPQNYLSAKLLVEAFYEAGMPKACLQLAMPDIPVLSKLIASEAISCVSFTGGVETAKKIAASAGPKKLLFELGGNDPLILMPDGDVDKAVETTINQRFGTAGQRCTACKRLFIHADVYDEFKTKLVEKASKIIIGDPMDKNTFIGPVVNKLAADQIFERIQEAIDQGATVLLGAKRDENIIHPTILENVPDTCILVADETFGPVVPLRKFETLDEVIKLINAPGFGLQSGVFTKNIEVIEKLYDELQVGTLVVNDGPGFRAEHFPFGGINMSGLGREGVKYAIDEMTFLKTLVM